MTQLSRMGGHLGRGIAWLSHVHTHWTTPRHIIPWHTLQPCGEKEAGVSGGGTASAWGGGRFVLHVPWRCFPSKIVLGAEPACWWLMSPGAVALSGSSPGLARGSPYQQLSAWRSSPATPNLSQEFSPVRDGPYSERIRCWTKASYEAEIDRITKDDC